MDEDEMMEEFASTQSLEPKVMESKEVVTQRIRDLCRYLKSNLSGLFNGGDKAAIKQSELITVLQELDEEFSHSFVRRASLLNLMAVRVTKVLQPIADAAAAADMNRADLTDAEIQEMLNEDGAVHGSVEVLWDTLMASLPGELGQLADLATVPVTCYLNSFLWDDPAWATVADNLIDSLDPLMDLYMGVVGFHMLVIYIRVMENKVAPTMTYHIQD